MSWFRGIRNNSTKSKYGSLRERFRNIPRRLGRKLKTLKRYITGTGSRGSLLGTAKRIGSKIRRTITRKTNLKEPWKMRWQDSGPYVESLTNKQNIDLLTELKPRQIIDTLGIYQNLNDQEFNQRKNEIERYIWGIIMLHNELAHRETLKKLNLTNTNIGEIGRIIGNLHVDYRKIDNLVIEIEKKLENENKNQREANIHSLKNKIRMQRKKRCRDSFQPYGVKSQEDRNINNLKLAMIQENMNQAQRNVNKEETDENLRRWEGRTPQPNALTPGHPDGEGWGELASSPRAIPSLREFALGPPSPHGTLSAAAASGTEEDKLQKEADKAADAWLNLPDWVGRDDKRQIAINAQKRADNARSGRIPLHKIVDQKRMWRLGRVYQAMNALQW